MMGTCLIINDDIILYFQGNSDRGWNDPPMFSFNPSLQQGSPRRLLNKRVAYPAAGLPTPGHAGLNMEASPLFRHFIFMQVCIKKMIYVCCVKCSV